MRNLFFILSLLVVYGCQVHENEDQLQLDPSSIIHGSTVNTYHEAASFSVGVLTLNGGICSGVVIGPKAILTNAHCIQSKDPSQLKVFPGSVITYRSDFLNVKSIYKHPKYDQQTGRHDLGLLILSDKIPSELKTIPLYSGPSLKGQITLESFGYSPYTKDSNEDFFAYFDDEAGTRKESSLYRTTHKHSLEGKLLSGTFDKTYGILLSQQSGGLCNGDSGGPTTVKINGKRALIGINRGGIGTDSGALTCSGLGIAVPVSPYIKWIKETLSEEEMSKIATRSLPKNATFNTTKDDKCLQASFVVFEKMKRDHKANGEFCQTQKELNDFLKINILEARRYCLSDFSQFYPTFLKNTQKKLKEKCQRGQNE